VNGQAFVTGRDGNRARALRSIDQAKETTLMAVNSHALSVGFELGTSENLKAEGRFEVLR
jgi:hypothetical protein